jgi:hypothetical protein
MMTDVDTNRKILIEAGLPTKDHHPNDGTMTLVHHQEKVSFVLACVRKLHWYKYRRTPTRTQSS